MKINFAVVASSRFYDTIFTQSLGGLLLLCLFLFALLLETYRVKKKILKNAINF
jgi:hypothetical protein